MGTVTGCAPKTVNEDAEAFLEDVNEVPVEDVKKEDVQKPRPVMTVGIPAGVTAMSLVGVMDKTIESKRVEVEYQIIPSPDLIAAKLINKEVDAMILPTNLAAILYNKGIEYKLAASTIWGTLYMVTTEDISSWEDLKGKEIYTIGRGLTPDVALRYLLEANGIDPDTDVTITYLSGATELAPTFLSGRSTISVMPEPMLTTILMKNQEAEILFDFQEEWATATGTGNSYPQASVMISDDFINEYPIATEAFVEMVDKSADWINDNPEEAGTAAEALDIKLKKKIVEKAVERSNIRFESAEDAKPAIETYFEILMSASKKLIGGKMPDEDFYYQK